MSDLRVTVKTIDSLGAGAVCGTQNIGARTVGIQGPTGPVGPVGPQGEQGVKGDIGLVWRGVYDPGSIYSELDAVSFDGSTYIYTSQTPTGISPPNSLYWDVVAAAATTGDKSYAHTQNIASDTWVINHNLGKYPSITVVDSANSEVEGDVEYVDNNTIVVRFSGAFSGYGYCN